MWEFLIPFPKINDFREDKPVNLSGYFTIFTSNACLPSTHLLILSFPDGSDSKESACNAEDSGLIPGSSRFPGEGNGYALQYSCLENFIDREASREQLKLSQFFIL